MVFCSFAQGSYHLPHHHDHVVALPDGCVVVMNSTRKPDALSSCFLTQLLGEATGSNHRAAESPLRQGRHLLYLSRCRFLEANSRPTKTKHIMQKMLTSLPLSFPSPIPSPIDLTITNYL
jgi:hypothetical protein